MASPQHALLSLSAAPPCHVPPRPFPAALGPLERREKDQPMPKEPKDRLTEWQPQAAVPTWNSMSPGEKMAWLLNQALDCKREILTMPLPDPSDDSIEAHRIRMLVLAVADSTIEQSIRLQTNQLKPAAADDDIGELLEERLRAANTEIERLSAEDCKYGDGKPSKPN
jgi:hypothetical protein